MNPRDRVAALLVLLTAAFAAFALGGAPRWAACTAAALGVASTAPYIGSQRSLTRFGPLLALIGVALGLTLVQLIPLPLIVVGLLSPSKLDLVRDNAAALGADLPAVLAVSYDPPATLVEVAKLIGFAAVAYTALRVSQSSAGRLLLASGLGCIALAMALVVVAHGAFGAEQLYGMYAPRFAHPTHLAPFLNPNHLAGFLALMAPICVGLAAHSAGGRRVTWGVISIAITGLSLYAASRAGSVVLVIGLLVTGGVLWAQRREATGESRQLSNVIGVSIVLACAAVVLGALAGRDVWMQIVATSGEEVAGNEGKLAAWRAAMPLIGEHWLAGVGRGGFESAFARVHGLEGRVYSHMENEYLQAFADWGIPAAALVGVLFIFLVRRVAARWRAGPIEAGAIGGLVAIGLHNLLDFSLSFAGVGTSAIIAIALVARGTLTKSRRQRTKLTRSAAIGLAAAAVALAATPLAASAREDVGGVRADWDAGKAPIRRAAAERAWARHPSDHVAAGYTALALFAEADPRAVAVVGRALDLNPRHPDLHSLAARLLIAARRPAQALVEYRLALLHASEADIDGLLYRLLLHFPDPAVALGGLPPDPARFQLLIERLLLQQHTWLALAYAHEVAQLHPEDGRAWQEVSRLAVRLGDSALAVRAGKHALARVPDAESAVVLAAAQTSGGAGHDAVQTLELALERSYPPSRTVTEVELLRGLGDAFLATGRPEQAQAALMKALGMAGSNRPRQATIHRSLALVQEALGNPNRAKWHRRQATFK